MKRQWRAGQVILTGLLLSLAGLAFCVWPVVSWKVAGEQAIGFDVAKGLVYTVKSDKGKDQLHGYDLWTGEKLLMVGLEPETSASQVERMKDVAESWKWHLSPNKRELIAISHLQTNIQLVELATGKQLRKLTFDKTARFFSLSDISIGFSRNGELFAIQDEIMHDILIWNLTNGEKSQIAAAEVPEFISHMSIITTAYYRPEIDLVDGVIAYSKGARSIVRNFVNEKLVFEHSAGSRPRFVDNGQLMIFTPVRIDKEQRPAWYRLDANSTWQPVSVELASGPSECHFVSYTDNLLVTDSALKMETKRPAWVPVWMWENANRLFGFNGVSRRLQLWDIHNGQLVREFRFFEPSTRFADYLEGLEKRVFVSEDGRWLAREHYGEGLIVSDTLERRSIWCWVVMAGLVLFAMRLGWSRKKQLV